MYGRPKFILFLLRFSLGWLLFYSGVTKVLDSSWTAKAYLENATTFSRFFEWLASSQNIVWVDFINQWGQILIGAALMIGVFTSFAAMFGAIMMFFYYLPIFNFPFVGSNGFIIDQHIVYILILLIIIRLKAGKSYSLGSLFGRSSY